MKKYPFQLQDTVSEGRIAYNEEWDGTAELRSDTEVERNFCSLLPLDPMYLAILEEQLAF